ncbi:MAG: hypothetical protein ACR2PF_14285 [Rhizobiaceae bacterium]
MKRLTDTHRQLNIERDRLTALASTPKSVEKHDSSVVWTLNLTCAGIASMLHILVAVFSGLYRYQMGLATFYKSRADALIYEWYDEVGMPLAHIADIFDPGLIDSAGAKPPTELAMDMARDAMKLGNRSGSR